MIDQFTTWVYSVRNDVDHVSRLLQMQLSAEPSDLIADLEAVEAWYSRLGELFALANGFLDRGKLFYLPPRSESLSEADRRAMVDNSTAEIRQFRDIVENLLDAIKQRLMLGMSILRFERPTMTPEVKNPSLKSAANIMRGE